MSLALPTSPGRRPRQSRREPEPVAGGPDACGQGRRTIPKRFGGLVLALVLGAGCTHTPAPTMAPTPSPLDLGRAYTDSFYAGRWDELWEKLSPEMRQVLGPDGLRAFRAQVEREIGTEAAVHEEVVVGWLGSDTYNRAAAFSKADPVWVRWTMDARGTVLGFEVEPGRSAAPSRFLDYRTRTALGLPFSGEWLVFWGGRSVIQNRHALVSNQRFAYDLVIARDGRTHGGSGSRNEDFFCFGEPILAPGRGTVVAAVDGVADNAPGTMNAWQLLGNHVVLDHGSGEFSFLAHLRNGSVEVRPGDTVERGSPLGRCGNSGNSSEPHLHYHLQTSAELERGEGLPAQFLDYAADGRVVARGEPSRGQSIRSR